MIAVILIMAHPIKAAAGILAARYAFRNSSGSFAKFTAMRLASSLLSGSAADMSHLKEAPPERSDGAA